MINLSIYFQQRKEKIALAKAAQDKKKADYKAGRAFGVSKEHCRTWHRLCTIFKK